jgi:glycosyltransferase involved in cell wall biosynthesis
MRLGIIASPRQSIDEPYAGGMEAHTAQLGSALRERGHDVTIHAAVSDDGAAEPMFADGEPLRLSGTARSDPSMSPLTFMQEHHAYLSLMMRVDSFGYDALHNNSLHYLPVAMAAGVRTPVVTTLHTPPTPWLESAIDSRIDRAAPHWVSVSRSNAALWGMEADCEVIHNGVDTEAWAFRSEPVRDRAVWTGRIVPEKGPHLAIKAARAAGMELLLAGPVGDHEYFRRKVESELDASARYVGHLRTRELAALVGSAEVALVTPCWDEPFGLVAIEALSCGTPVAAFDRGALREIVDLSCGALVSGTDPARLGAAISEALAKDRASCRRRAIERFSIANMVKRYERVYSRVARC